MAPPLENHSFVEAVAVRQLSSHRYAGYLQDDWCIGSVPNGGYAAAVMLAASRMHFQTTHGKRKPPQPDVVTAHFEFLIKTQMGPAEVAVKDVKLGRGFSVVHLALVQEGMEVITAYVIHGNIALEEGLSLPTWKPAELTPQRPCELSLLRSGQEAGWREITVPYGNFRKAATKCRFFVPVEGQSSPSAVDQWICFTDGSKITNPAMGFFVDMFLTMIEQYNPNSPWSSTPKSSIPDGASLPEKVVSGTDKSGKVSAFWYPTLVLNMDFKKSIPKEGIDFIFTRVVAKQIKNGRFDLDLTIYDPDGDILALSTHVVLVLSADRNLSKRTVRAGKI